MSRPKWAKSAERSEGEIIFCFIRSKEVVGSGDYFGVGDLRRSDECRGCDDDLLHPAAQDSEGIFQLGQHPSGDRSLGAQTLESRGIDPEILERYAAQCVRIPMKEGLRSLNLSNAAAIGAYEALRQNGFSGLV